MASPRPVKAMRTTRPSPMLSHYCYSDCRRRRHTALDGRRAPVIVGFWGEDLAQLVRRGLPSVDRCSWQSQPHSMVDNAGGQLREASVGTNLCRRGLYT
ncbi:hypothetical protein EIP91_006891 [Steccherinum ochraceum]|uniref:Uncharacterized protein n=1 Tax=Steccherinum ochraceum TaxID=92696 RepID=A0A4R0RFL4_9APHY|nr:hypothetical protein EIP91_006891 [Steccherinum ochraceum]